MELTEGITVVRDAHMENKQRFQPADTLVSMAILNLHELTIFVSCRKKLSYESFNPKILFLTL